MIADYIRKQKDRFFQQRAEKKINRLRDEAEALKKERLRQGQIAEAEARRQREERHLTSIKGYNEKQEAQHPSIAKRFASGLAEAMNKKNLTPTKVKNVNTRLPRDKSQKIPGEKSNFLFSNVNNNNKSVGFDKVGKGLQFGTGKGLNISRVKTKI
jgi:hypothetical protein